MAPNRKGNIERKCRICECTDFDGCASDIGGCTWSEDNLCSTCAHIGAALLEWFQSCGPMIRRSGSLLEAMPALTRLVSEITDIISAVEEDLPDPEPAIVLATEADMKAAIARGGR